MNLIKKIFVVILFMQFCSCVDKSVIGTYERVRSDGKKESLELRKDSSYVFSFGKKVRQGKWTHSIDKGHLYIYFGEWIAFDEDTLTDPYHNSYLSVELKGGELLFDYDLPERNFYKK